MKAYADLGDKPEDERITILGTLGETQDVAFVVDDDAKADRYVRKLLDRHRVRVVNRCYGPIATSVTVVIGPVAGLN